MAGFAVEWPVLSLVPVKSILSGGASKLDSPRTRSLR